MVWPLVAALPSIAPFVAIVFYELRFQCPERIGFGEEIVRIFQVRPQSFNVTSEEEVHETEQLYIYPAGDATRCTRWIQA